MTIPWIIALGGAAYSAALGAIVLGRAPRHPAHLSYAIGMFFLATDSVISGFALAGKIQSNALEWHEVWMLFEDLKKLLRFAESL